MNIPKFDNNQYESLVSDLIGDAFYTETSYRGKISTIRSYAEVIVRKLLDFDQSKKITLGQDDVKKKIKELPGHEFLEKAIKTILKSGNAATHTQYLEKFSLDDFNQIVNNLLDMLAFLLINYFEKYKFGSRNEVMRSFSLLPPIIRYKVLAFLYKKYPDNIDVIDRLTLAIMKAFSVAEATKWVEDRKNDLLKMKIISMKELNKIAEKYGEEVAEIMLQNASFNMYQSCMKKIFQLRQYITENGPLYSNFEDALPYYRMHGKIDSDDPEIVEFNDIMDFLYLGRKERLEQFSRESGPLVIMNFFL